MYNINSIPLQVDSVKYYSFAFNEWYLNDHISVKIQLCVLHRKLSTL